MKKMRWASFAIISGAVMVLLSCSQPVGSIRSDAATDAKVLIGHSPDVQIAASILDYRMIGTVANFKVQFTVYNSGSVTNPIPDASKIEVIVRFLDYDYKKNGLQDIGTLLGIVNPPHSPLYGSVWDGFEPDPRPIGWTPPPPNGPQSLTFTKTFSTNLVRLTKAHPQYLLVYVSYITPEGSDGNTKNNFAFPMIHG